MGGLLLIVLAVAAVVERQRKAETAAAAPAAAAPAPASAPTDATAEQLKGVRAEVDGLAKQLKDLQARLDALPKPEPAPDFKPIQGKLDDLAKAVESVGPLPEKVGKLDERLGGLDEGLKAVRGEVADLKGEVAKAAARPSAEVAGGGGGTSAAADDAALTQGADLFKAGRYKEAGETFRKLAAGEPKDARVYYYAALANGAATNDWTGETARLVARGVALEKAGTPKASEIDTAFAGVPARMKDWLDYYRKSAR
jgi:TolA-binding protein